MKNQKKILIIIPTLRYGGTEHVLIEIIQELVQKGFYVYIYSHILPEAKYIKNIISNDKIKFINSKLNFLLKLIDIKKLIKNYKIKKVLALQSGIIYAHIANLIFYKNLIVIGRVSTLVSAQYDKGNIFIKFKLLIYLYCLSKINTVIAQSKNMKKDLKVLLKKYRFKINTKFQVIYNPIDKNKILKQSKLNTIHQKREFIFFYGRIEKVKNLKKFLSYYYESKLYSNYDFIVMGEGLELNKLKQSVELYNLKSYIKFLNFNKNPFGYLLNCKLFVLPSIYEGYSNTLIQSIILKKNVLVSKGPGGNKEILGDFYSLLSFDFNSTLKVLNFKKKLEQIFNYYNYNKKDKLYKIITLRHDKEINKYISLLDE